MSLNRMLSAFSLLHMISVAARGKVPEGSIKVFWHIYATDHWAYIVRDQLTKMTFSGLYDHASEINCFIAGHRDIDINTAASMITSWGKKFLIRAKSASDSSYERFTLSRIRPLLCAADKFLYLHSKGVTHPPPDAVDKTGINIYYWRTHMEYYLIRHHQRCTSLLDTYDTVGVDLFQPGGWIYAGNFWWSRADFFLGHPVSIGTDYYAPEHYLLDQHSVNMSRVFSLAQSAMIQAMQSGDNEAHYHHTYLPNRYIDEWSKFVHHQ